MRSLFAVIVSSYIRHHMRMNPKMMEEALSDQSDKILYDVPKKYKFSGPIEKVIFDKMPVFKVKRQSKDDYILLYIHGGAYVHPFSPFHWRFLSKVSRKSGCGLAVPNYLKLPHYTYKESHQQMMNFYKEFSKEHDMRKVIIAGDSAGGGFVLSILQQARDMNLPLPKKAILFSPWVDVIGGNPNLDKKDAMLSYKVAKIPGTAWAGGDDPHNKLVSPLYGKMDNLPPIDIYVGTYEILYDDCLKTYRLLKDAGNDTHLFVAKKLGHVYPLWPVREANKPLKAICQELTSK